MQLIYGANTYQLKSTEPKPQTIPYALNWRYRIPGQSYGARKILYSASIDHRAINWRYQLPAM